MKRIILFTVIVLNNHLKGQEYICLTPDEDIVATRSGYEYDPNGDVKTIRVNFHFLLRSDGTGNFTETSDNYSTRPYNGYFYADDMIRWCNQHWNQNPLLKHMPMPPVPALHKKIQFQLTGVFFHRNTTEYDSYYDCNVPHYVENSGEVINIYITKAVSSTSGCAIGSCNGEKTNICNAYESYKQSVNNNDTWYNSYAYICINHEVGHLFGLPHPLRLGGGTCCRPPIYCDDGCDDTPTYEWLINNGFPDDTDNNPCCWNCPAGSNNLMDYSAGGIALSPCQISKIHECIDGTKLFYRNCKYKTQSLNITSYTGNEAYIAKSVTIPSNSNVVVNNNGALFVNAQEFTIDGEFEVQLGSVFNLDIVPACDGTGGSGEDENKIILYPNFPNPFYDVTTVECYVSDDVAEVQLCVYNMDGDIVFCFDITERGMVSVQIMATELSGAGEYTYLLFGDGYSSEEMQMVLME